MTTNQKIRTIQFINLLLSLFAIYYALTTGPAYLLILSYLMFVILCPIGISVGLHRLLAHRSFTTTPFIEKVLSIQVCTLQWVLRLHGWPYIDLIMDFLIKKTIPIAHIIMENYLLEMSWLCGQDTALRKLKSQSAM